jgi:hypothetical protein
MVKHLLSKHKALRSNPSTTQKNKNKKKESMKPKQKQKLVPQLQLLNFIQTVETYIYNPSTKIPPIQINNSLNC